MLDTFGVRYSTRVDEPIMQSTCNFRRMIAAASTFVLAGGISAGWTGMLGHKAPDPFPRIVFEVPISTPGIAKPADGKGSQSLHAVRAWINRDTKLVIEPSGTTPTIADRPEVSACLASIQRLLKEYRSGDFEAVIKLYDEQSQQEIQRIVSTPERRQAWIRAAKDVQRGFPKLIYLSGDDRVCMLRLETADGTGGTRSTPFVVVLGKDGRPKATKLDSGADKDLTLFFAQADADPVRLIANFDYVRELLSGGK